MLLRAYQHVVDCFPRILENEEFPLCSMCIFAEIEKTATELTHQPILRNSFNVSAQDQRVIYRRIIFNEYLTSRVGAIGSTFLLTRVCFSIKDNGAARTRSLLIDAARRGVDLIAELLTSIRAK